MSSNTPPLEALDNDPAFDYVFRCKFDTKQNGTPLHCITCAGPIVLGQSYTGKTLAGKYENYCATCAGSWEAMLKGLYGRVLTLKAECDADSIALTDTVLDAMTAANEKVSLFMSNQCDATFRPAKAALMNVRMLVGVARSAKRTEARVAALQSDPLYVGLVLATTVLDGKHKNDAVDIAEKWARYGSLTPAQQKYVEFLASKAEKVAAKQAVAADAGIDIPTGLYLTVDLVVRRIYKGGGHLCCRVYDGVTFEYEPGGVRKVADALLAGTARMMNQEEATRYGKQAGRCFSCLSIGRPGKLSDDRSISVGYGPDCADWHGWYYPTAEEAAAILRGEAK